MDDKGSQSPGHMLLFSVSTKPSFISTLASSSSMVAGDGGQVCKLPVGYVLYQWPSGHLPSTHIDYGVCSSGTGSPSVCVGHGSLVVEKK